MTDYLTPLPVDALRDAGIPAPWTYGIRDKVRFYELDALNHVNNTAYLRWFETIRVRSVIDYGISAYGPDDPNLVVRAVTCDYLIPMVQNDDYIVTARCDSFRITSFRQIYAVWRNEAICATGTAVIVTTDRSGEVKLPLSDGVRATLAARDGATDAR